MKVCCGYLHSSCMCAAVVVSVCVCVYVCAACHVVDLVSLADHWPGFEPLWLEKKTYTNLTPFGLTLLYQTMEPSPFIFFTPKFLSLVKKPLQAGGGMVFAIPSSLAESLCRL